MTQRIIITGGAGFIGSHLITLLMQKTQHEVLNLDKLTYAANPHYLKAFKNNPRYKFLKLDICEKVPLELAIREFRPHKIMHLAAESHVDRSISQSDEFVQTNIVGTYNLLECARSYFTSLSINERKDFLFHHISTDEVYGDLPHPDDEPECKDLFTEKTSYAPSSPYSATKAGSDHLVRAWHRTYGLPTLITNCSNNYGPHQHKEKLIPLTIAKALAGKKIPVYGNGRQIRDWLYVKDHVEALYLISQKGKAGETYNIGGNNEHKNIEVVKEICSILDDICPRDYSYHELISFVRDRPGHDRRYAIDAQKILKDLGWQPRESFESGLRKTIEWYLKETTPTAEAAFADKLRKQTLDNPKRS